MNLCLGESIRRIRQRTSIRTFDLAVVLGSGLGDLVESTVVEAVIPYADLPLLPKGQVAGHQGHLVIARVQQNRLLIFQGRFHLYQGLSAREAATPIVLAHALGCTKILLTNASGGIRDDLQPGDLMFISDHINLMGDNPLRGEQKDPFVSLIDLYPAGYYPPLRQVAEHDGWSLHQGVLCGMAGPSYETPAEIRALQLLGADAVSMSTIPEAIMARYLGLTVVGLSLIANRAAGLSSAPLSHAEVLAAGAGAVPRLATLLKALLEFSAAA
jgi:purine-nucleoside phosphorylase